MKLNLTSIDFTDNTIHKRFDQSFITRYSIVAEIINQLRPHISRKESLKILDLGGYNGAARDLLKDKITILDIFDDDELEDYIKVDTVGIPCEDDAFDIVISTDVMEHIPPSHRNIFLQDAVRVAKYATIIAAPFEHGENSVAYEELMANSIYVGETKQDYSWLKEHRDYGLPQRSWIEKWLTGKGINYTRFSHTSLRLWSELLTIGYFLANNVKEADIKLGKRLSRLNDDYFKNIAAVDFPANGYRTFYVISKTFHDMSVQLPEYNQRTINQFTSKCRMILGMVFSKMSELLHSYKADIHKYAEQEAKLYQELEQLRKIEERYTSLRKKPAYKLAAGVKRIITRK